MIIWDLKLKELFLSFVVFNKEPKSDESASRNLNDCTSDISEMRIPIGNNDKDPSAQDK